VGRVAGFELLNCLFQLIEACFEAFRLGGCVFGHRYILAWQSERLRRVVS
jgi:hypothetical protein